MKKYELLKYEKIDYDESIKLFSKGYNHIHKGQCYNNVFVLFPEANQLKKEKLEIIYGYVLSQNVEKKIAVRHCYYRIDKKIVDPTMIIDGYVMGEANLFKYVPIVAFEDMNEYFNLIELNKMLPALEDNFDNESKIIELLLEQGYRVIL